MLTFERRYIFKGKLTLSTALHIGGARGTLSPTDSPVIRAPDMKPFIPGSSMKGSFRSTVEKIVPALSSLRTCALTDGEGGDNGQPCPGAPGKAQEQFNSRRREEEWDESKFLAELAVLCDTCKLFGSPFQAGKICFDDLMLAEWPGTTQIRDGVAIDRDSERAVPHLKYDYEVVPPGSAFDLCITLEEPTETDLRLTCLGVGELVSGFGGVGGKRTCGLGRCLLEDLKVYELDLSQGKTRAELLKRYLMGKKMEDKMTLVHDANAFLQERIDQLVKEG